MKTGEPKFNDSGLLLCNHIWRRNEWNCELEYFTFKYSTYSGNLWQFSLTKLIQSRNHFMIWLLKFEIRPTFEDSSLATFGFFLILSSHSYFGNDEWSYFCSQVTRELVTKCHFWWHYTFWTQFLFPEFLVARGTKGEY